MAWIIWTCRIEAEPNEPITELPVWSGQVRLSDMAPTITMADLGREAVNVLGAQFLEDFLLHTGAAEKMPSGYADHAIKVTVVKIPKV